MSLISPTKRVELGLQLLRNQQPGDLPPRWFYLREKRLSKEVLGNEIREWNFNKNLIRN